MSMDNENKNAAPLPERFAANGYTLDGIDEKELMRFMLDSCISRKTRSRAAEQALIDRLGSVSRLIFAPLSELCGSGALTDGEAARLKLIGAMFVAAELEKLDGAISADDEAAIGRYLPLLYLSHPVEVLYVIPVVGKKLGEPRLLAKGTEMNVGIGIERITDVLDNVPSCKECILVHSHPGGSSKPSPEDIRVTELIFRSLFSCGYFLREHYVLGRDGISRVPYDRNPMRAYLS